MKNLNIISENYVFTPELVEALKTGKLLENEKKKTSIFILFLLQH